MGLTSYGRIIFSIRISPMILTIALGEIKGKIYKLSIILEKWTKVFAQFQFSIHFFKILS